MSNHSEKESTRGPRDNRWYLSIMSPDSKGEKFAWLDPISIYIYSKAFGILLDDLIEDLASVEFDVVADLAAIAIEENERTRGYREQYDCASAVIPGSVWQTQCNAQFLESFNDYEASRTFPNAGRQG